MADVCKLCKKEFKSFAGLKCHLTVKHGISYEDYKNQLRKAKSNKGMLKSTDNGNNSNNDTSPRPESNETAAAAVPQLPNEQNVIDLTTYKEDKESPNVRVLTPIEAERWGRLSAERKNTLQAIRLYENQITIERQNYETSVGKHQAEIIHLKNMLDTTVNPEYEQYMHTLAERYGIPRNMIGIHLDTRVIWDLRDSKEVPKLKEQT